MARWRNRSGGPAGGGSAGRNAGCQRRSLLGQLAHDERGARAEQHRTWLKSAPARKERQESRSRFRGLKGAEATRAVRQALPGAFESKPWAGLELRSGDQLEGYAGRYGAKIKRAGASRSTLVESTLPLLAGEPGKPQRPVDLSIRPDGGGFAPVNAPVPMRFPKDLSEGLTLPDIGVKVTPVGASASGPGDPGRSLLWSNVATDTDFGVVPRPSGFQTFHALRSPASPETLKLKLGLPAGATLRPAAKGKGEIGVGLEVVREGKVIARVHPPVATDAQGQPVPVSMEAVGGRLSLNVQHRDRDLAYPIAVDPLVEDQSYFGTNNQAGWEYLSSHGYFGSNHTGHLGPGRYLILNGFYYSDGDFAWWRYRAPGNSRITYAQFYYAAAAQYDSRTCTGLGIYRRGNDGAVNPPQAGSGYCSYDFAGWYPAASTTGSPGNQVIFNYVALGTGWRGNGYSFLQGVYTQLEDDYAPFFYQGAQHQSLPSGWTDRATPETTPYVQDDGLGVKRLAIRHPKKEGGTAEKEYVHGCTGTAASRCPSQLSQAITYNSDDMPEGINDLNATATDVVGNPSASAPWTIKVDRTGPSVEFAGSLKNAENTHVAPGSYQLTVEAKDGTNTSAATRRSGVESNEMTLDGETVASDSQPCATDSCPLNTTWSFNTADVPSGQHTVEVVSTDHAGNETQRTFEFSSGTCCFSTPGNGGSALLEARIGVADVTGDGLDDFVGRIPLTNEVRIHAAGDNGFEAGTSAGSYGNLTDWQLADVDGDYDADLIARDAATNTVKVAMSNGSGFGALATWQSWPSSRSIRFGDLDGDGTADLVGRDGTTGAIYVSYSDEGVAEPPETVTSATFRSGELTLGDVDGDDAADVLVRNGNAVSLSLYDEGDFNTVAWQGTLATSERGVLADANGDGRADLITTDQSSGAVSVRSSNGSSFGSAQGSQFGAGYEMEPGDVDDDARFDIVGFQPVTGELRVAKSNMATPSMAPDGEWTADAGIVYDTSDESEPADPATPPEDPAEPTPAATASAKPKLRLAFQDEGVLNGRRGIPGVDPAQAYGTGAHKAAAVAALDRIYARFKEAGGNSAKAKPVTRFIAYWGRYQNRSNGSDGYLGNGQKFDFSKLQEDVALAKSKGFDVYLTLSGYAKSPGSECADYNPSSISCGAGGVATGANPNPEEFAAFAGSAAKTFKGDVIAYGLWNEPNNPDFLRAANRRQIPWALYRSLYTKGFNAVRATGNYPQARVFIGEMSYIGKRDPLGKLDPESKKRPLITPSKFLEKVLSGQNGTITTHGVAWHPYQVMGDPRKPNANGGERGIGRWRTIQKELDRLYKTRVGNTSTGRRLLRTPDNKNPPLYFTEFGYFNQRPQLKPKKKHLWVLKWQTEATKSTWLKYALSEAAKSRARWMLLYQAVEIPPAGIPGTDSNGKPLDPNYGKPSKDDYGLFRVDGAVRGTRPYGKGTKDGIADNKQAKYPQARRSYCAIYRWTRARGYANAASSNFGTGDLGPCP